MIPHTSTVRHLSRRLFVVPLCLLLMGCGAEGEQRATVTGRVTDNGQPITVDPQGMLRIEFLRYAGESGQRQVQNAVSADLDADGKYTLQLPPGDYAVHVIHQPKYRGPDVLEAVFHGVESPLVKQIDGDLELNIEIADYRQKK